MARQITVDIGLTGAVHVPVSVTRETVLTRDEYAALEEKEHDTLYLLLDTLIDGSVVIGEICQGEDTVYTRQGGDFGLYPVRYVPYAPDGAGCYVTSDGKVYRVPEQY